MLFRPSTREKRGQTRSLRSASFNLGADIDQLGKERRVEALLEEGDAGGAAGAALEADHALDGLDLPEAPELEVLFDVDQLLAHVVLGPVLLCILINDFENRGNQGMAFIRLAPVALHALGRDRHSAARKVAQELVIEARRLEQLGHELLDS